MTQSPATLQADFDRLAPYDRDGWTHNNHYHPFLLRQMPTPCDQALEIGCGTGTFARLMAARANHVTALDLSPEMLRLARERSAVFPNIAYQQADFMTWDAPDASYDCIASIATLHHMPISAALGKMARLLRPGGVLLILDLYAAHTPVDLLYSGMGFIATRILHRIKDVPMRVAAAEADAWDAHGATDVYPTLAEVRAALPGARVRRHLLFRYSLIWRKSPAG